MQSACEIGAAGTTRCLTTAVGQCKALVCIGGGAQPYSSTLACVSDLP